MKKGYIEKRRILPAFVMLVVFMLMVVPVFAGGNRQSGTQQAAQATDKMTSLKVMQYKLDNQQIDFENLWFYKEVERRTGVKVVWQVVSQAAWDTTRNLAFASGDLPDLFRSGGINVEEYGVTQKQLVPLDSYIQANMPNYYSRLYLNDADKAMYASDGHMYWIANLTAQNVNHIGNHYINKSWLDRLGLAIPRTVDELTTVLRAFRDRAPNGNAATVIPFAAGGDNNRPLLDRTQGLGPHFGMFGVPLHENGAQTVGNYAAINAQGKVQFVTEYPGFRPALEWLAMCYSEGLLDRESLTQNSGEWAVKVNAGRVGFFSYLRLINSALSADAGANFVSILPPASQYGVQVARMIEVPEAHAYISRTNRYVAQTLQWLDAQLETETMMVAVNGPLLAGAPIPPTLRVVDGKFDVISTPEANVLYSVVPVWHALFFAPGDYYFPIFNMPPHRVERYESSKAYQEAGVLEPGSYTILNNLIKPDNNDSAELSRLITDIDRLVQESVANFIQRGVTDATYTAFLREITNVGVPRYITLLQKYYDVYAASVK